MKTDRYRQRKDGPVETEAEARAMRPQPGMPGDLEAGGGRRRQTLPESLRRAYGSAGPLGLDF